MIVKNDDLVIYDEDPMSCFYCSQKVSSPYIEWEGNDGLDENVSITLHPKCALSFFLRLAGDIREVERDIAK